MIFEVLAVAKMSMFLFWAVTPYGLVGREEHAACIFSFKN
jgi:hypothetical protein